MENGERYVYTGNVHDTEGQTTYCPSCNAVLIERDWYRLGAWGLDANGACHSCGMKIPGHFDATPERFGARRLPVRLAT